MAVCVRARMHMWMQASKWLFQSCDRVHFALMGFAHHSDIKYSNRLMKQGSRSGSSPCSVIAKPPEQSGSPAHWQLKEPTCHLEGLEMCTRACQLSSLEAQKPPLCLVQSEAQLSANIHTTHFRAVGRNSSPQMTGKTTSADSMSIILSLRMG